MSSRFLQPEEVQKTLTDHIDYMAMQFQEFLRSHNSTGKTTWYVWRLGEGSILGGIEFWPHADPNEDPISATIDLRPYPGGVRYLAKIEDSSSVAMESILEIDKPTGLLEDEVSVVDRLTIDIRDRLLARLEAVASHYEETLGRGEPNQ